MKSPELKSLLGHTIRSSRSELHMSQEELADRAGLHRTYVSDVERGRRNISLENIEKLAQALELSVSKLFAKAGDGSIGSPFVELLLIEDDPGDAELTVRAFRKAKIANMIHVVRDGAEALDFLFATGGHEHRKNQPLPGVILLDLNLPKLDGLEVLRRIKADRQLRQIPVIVLTVSDRDGDVAECRRLGVANYLVKPVGFQKFSEIVPNLDLEWTLGKPSRKRVTRGDG